MTLVRLFRYRVENAITTERAAKIVLVALGPGGLGILSMAVSPDLHGVIVEGGEMDDDREDHPERMVEENAMTVPEGIGGVEESVGDLDKCRAVLERPVAYLGCHGGSILS
jgi:hypothetical protein